MSIVNLHKINEKVCALLLLISPVYTICTKMRYKFLYISTMKYLHVDLTNVNILVEHALPRETVRTLSTLYIKEVFVMNKYQVIFYDIDENNEYFSVFVKARNDSFALPIAFHKLDKSGNSHRSWDEIRVILVKEGR